MQPVADRDGRVHGVMIAIRAAAQPPFGEPELRKLEALADAWAPFIHQLALHQETEAILRGPDRGGHDVFRQEAIEHFVRRGQRGDVVRVHPGWVHAAYWLVVVFVLGGAGYAAVAQVHKWSEGPGVVRVTGRTDVTTYEGGTITALAVAPDQAVTAGQELARLHDSEQAAILRAQSTEFERTLVAYLQTPGDPTVKQALSALVAARDSARARSEARVIRAPHDGVVKSLHVAPGQRVEPGKTILSLVERGAEEGMSVYAFLPQADTSQIDGRPADAVHDPRLPRRVRRAPRSPRSPSRWAPPTRATATSAIGSRTRSRSPARSWWCRRGSRRRRSRPRARRTSSTTA